MHSISHHLLLLRMICAMRITLISDYVLLCLVMLIMSYDSDYDYYAYSFLVFFRISPYDSYYAYYDLLCIGFRITYLISYDSYYA